MGEGFMKHFVKLGLLSLSATVLAACSSDSSEEITIRVATSPGPYSELFLDQVAPKLEEEGYTVEEIEFTDVRSVDVALQEGSVDLNVDQHSLYLANFNEEAGAELTAVTPVPTVPAGLFPGTKDDLVAVSSGDRVGIPDDPSNYTRALLVLEKAGWIKLNEDANLESLTVDDISENTAGIEIVPMQSATIPRTLEDLAYAIIPGSIAYDAGVDFSTMLLAEDVREDLLLQAVVSNPETVEEEWVQAVVDIYNSDEFQSQIEEINHNSDETYWIIPD
ncbi:NLPA lipoprotein [Aerococcus viridans ATCC 11563 = CCUG 4311]|uniref:NLPA lipoprotein n=2 Tax=Aerococcus viridans TaxID=1377 RepID=A0ABN0A9W2_AERVM|nr:NLPA lipoprotein [Aerococcus viridans ATCC 11563 = CCUG 4311]